jgi:TonB family protein
MPAWPCAALTCLVLLAGRAAAAAAAASAPGPDSVVLAHVALRFDPVARCPDIRHADPEDEMVALVLFHVGATGVPSQASIKSSSRSETLDAAAVSCVMSLRFQPATRAGDGTAIDSWQEIAWRWARPREHQQAGSAASLPGPAAVASVPTHATGTQAAVAAAMERKVDMRVCFDEAGRLAREPTVIRSSGDPALDETALKIARAGSGYYRYGGGTNANPAAGCLQLSISPEQQ